MYSSSIVLFVGMIIWLVAVALCIVEEALSLAPLVLVMPLGRRAISAPPRSSERRPVVSCEGRRRDEATLPE